MARVTRRMYSEANVGSFPETFEFLGTRYEKVDDLRYGTNPHQTAAYYRPLSRRLILGHYRLLKSGKNGLSQTNLEDMDRALRIVSYSNAPAAALMKHVNPSGVAEAIGAESLATAYRRARESDAQAAFCATVGLNRSVDTKTAEEIMSTVIDCVVAPGYEEGALDILSSGSMRKRNREIRVVEVANLEAFPRYEGDDTTDLYEVRTLADGSLIVSTPLVTRIRSSADLLPATTTHRLHGEIRSERVPTEREAEDLVFAWHVAMQVRSNAMILAKSRSTLAVGTGEQDRIGALEQAIEKYRNKYRGTETLAGAVLASDGYFPFRDCVDAAAAAGITAIVHPGGGVNDYDVICAVNEKGMALVFTGERCFSHH